MKIKKQVSKQEFLDFLENYPRKLSIDICGISDPPIVTWNDFKIADKWPESVVASTMKYSDDPNDYFYEPEENRKYFIVEES